MKNLLALSLFSLLLSTQVFGQQEYFSDKNKSEGLAYFSKKIKNGCVAPKDKQDPIPSAELKEMGKEALGFINKNFSKAFKENPKLQYALESDIQKLASDSGCQRFGNNCRTKIVATSMYYMQQLRPDIEGCLPGQTTLKRCEIEKQYRKSNLEGARSKYGVMDAGSYKKELLLVKNSTLINVFNAVMKNGPDQIHLCNEVLSGNPYRYALDFDNTDEFNENIDPNFNPTKDVLSACEEPTKVLLAEFIAPKADETRGSSGRDVVEPVKIKIENFLKSHPEMIITNVNVTVNTNKQPQTIVVNGKKIRDPESDSKSLGQATDKLIFIQQILEEISKSSTQYTHIQFSSSAQLAGPDFTPMDMNDRWVTKMTPGYFDRVKSVFEKNKEAFENDALIKSHEDLIDENKYPNLYLAKFKPFQGFRIEILGHIKSEMKCSKPLVAPKKRPASRKQ